METLAITFNEAFSDYLVAIKISEEQLAEKIKSSNIRLDLSPGAFVDGKLVGFVWHGLGQRNGSPVLWNGGTGVIPSQRGQGISGKLYDYILPELRERGYERTALEVIIGNDPAIHTYQKKGFEVTRTLDCFRGRLAEPTVGGISDSLDRRILKKPLDWTSLHRLRSWQPTFQNDDARMDLLGDKIRAEGIFSGEELVGYILFDARWDYGDIYQFGVREDYRQQGIGKYLLSIAQYRKTVPLKIINVDAGHQPSTAFFKAIGFERIIGQYEMIMDI